MAQETRSCTNDPEVEKKQGWVNVGDLEGCVHYKVGTFCQHSETWNKKCSPNISLDLGGSSFHSRLCLDSFFIPVKYERIKFLVLALKNAVEVYALGAPKPYHKFMAFKVSVVLGFDQGLCRWNDFIFYFN